ncbi:cytochrome P450, partial [Coprinellus micaceus]
LPGSPPLSPLTGNLAQLFDPKGLAFHLTLCEVYGGAVRVYGFLPVLGLVGGEGEVYVSDPRAISAILGKEGECFDETGVFLECNKIIFGPGLVSTTGALHRRQRKLALPMFSTGRLGAAAGVVGALGRRWLVRVLQDEVISQRHSCTQGTLDMSEWTARVSLEAAGRAILGYSFDPLDSRVANAYTRAIKELIPTLFSLALIRNFAPFLVKLGPPSFRRWVVQRIPSRRVRRVVESSDVMHESAKRILEERRAALSMKDGGGDTSKPKDIISTLLHTNSLCAEEERMSDAELTGQVTVLVFGAQDTTGERACEGVLGTGGNGSVQRKVRAEIKRAWAEGKYHIVTNEEGKEEKRLDVDVVMGLPWLDAAVKETLRVYPPVPFVRRVCTRDAEVPYTPFIPPTSPSPGSPPAFTNATEDTPGSSQERREVEFLYIPKGTKLFLSIVGCNRSKEIWGEDAGVWRPERWLSSSESSDHVKIPGAWNGMLTFLGGGRSCVGSRFAIMEMKIILATVLSKMYFKPTDDEVVWNLSQIISPSIVHRHRKSSNGKEVEEVTEKGLPLVAVLDDLTVGV